MNRDEVSNRVKLVDLCVLSDNHYTLHKAAFDYRRNDGARQTVSRESYGIGRSVAVLPMTPRATVFCCCANSADRPFRPATASC
jgi:hypothetical protein